MCFERGKRHSRVFRYKKVCFKCRERRNIQRKCQEKAKVGDKPTQIGITISQRGLTTDKGKKAMKKNFLDEIQKRME